MNHTHNGSCCQGVHSDNEDKGHGCGGCNCGHHQTEIEISEEETEFLKLLAATPYLPLARFILKSAKSAHFESVALAPVYITHRSDSMEVVKSIGVVLKNLENKGLITLDYEEPLVNGDYADYTNSALYSYFKETVAQVEDKDDYIFDIPSLELGSIALTSLGQLVIESFDDLDDSDR